MIADREGNTAAPRSRGQLVAAFITSAAGTGFSRVFGALRDIVIAHIFGAGRLTDAFWIAFTIPSVFRRFVADEGLTGALIPGISQEETRNGQRAAMDFTDAIFTVLITVLSVLILAGMLFAPVLVRLFAWGFADDPDLFFTTVLLTRWLFPFVGMVSLVSFCEGILNYRGHFFIPKIAPGIVSLAIVLAAAFLRDSFHPAILALIPGVLVGGILHLLIHIPILRQRWRLPRFGKILANPAVKKFSMEMGKVILIGIFAQLNIMILRSLASLLPAGSVTYYWNANRLVDLAQGMVGVGIGSALMPLAAKSVAAKDWPEVNDQFHQSIQLSGFLLVPVAVFLAVFSLPLVCMLYRHGAFTVTDARITAQTLIFLAPFLLCVAAINILKKIYFALDDRNSLLLIGGAGVCLTGILGYLFIRLLGIRGLALALSISSLTQTTAYFFLLKINAGRYLRFRAPLVQLMKIALLSVPVLGVLLAMTRIAPWENGPTAYNLAAFSAAAAASILVYILTAAVFKSQELRTLRDQVVRRRGYRSSE